VEALGDDLLLVQLGEGTTFRLNQTGRFVWELAGAGLTMEQISQRLASHFAIPLQQATQDASLLLDDLLKSHLLEPMNEVAP
jgi:hypothetical protein